MADRSLLVLSLALLSASPATAVAQRSLTREDPVTEDFTGFTAAGFSPAPTPGQLDSNEWAVVGVGGNYDLIFGELATGPAYTHGLSTGGVEAGGVYAFDTGSNVTLGAQPDGSEFTPGVFAFRVRNGTGGPLVGVHVQYDLWVHNDGERSTSVRFVASAEPPVGDYEPTPEDEDPSARRFSAAESDAAGWQVETITAMVTFSTPVAAGSNVVLGWVFVDAGGSNPRDELAIDNVSVAVLGTASPDAGAVAGDAGPPPTVDGGLMERDAGVSRIDAGPDMVSDRGCGCRVPGRGCSNGGAPVVFLLLYAIATGRRRRPRQ